MDQLKATYNAINARSIPQAQTELNGPQIFCKAIWTIGHWTHTEAFERLQTALRTIESQGILFDLQDTQGQLHWTLFQLQTFPVIPTAYDANILSNEAQTLKKIVGSFPSFNVEFKGISKTRFGLFLNGYPSVDVNTLRDKIRTLCKNIIEPHPQDICHATLFRFTHPPSEATLAFLDTIVAEFENVLLTTMRPSTWEYGFGSWLQKIRIIASQWPAAPRWILHRGLKYGTDPLLENQETLLWKRLQEGWDVEIDVWCIDGLWWLGHDKPSAILQNRDLLLHPRAWIHCKNLEALSSMPDGAHYFTHNSDPATLTSNKYIWYYPGNFAGGERSVIVMPERAGLRFPTLSLASAVCSDYLPANFYI
jgi:hypothetical protein